MLLSILKYEIAEAVKFYIEVWYTSGYIGSFGDLEQQWLSQIGCVDIYLVAFFHSEAIIHQQIRIFFDQI